MKPEDNHGATEMKRIETDLDDALATEYVEYLFERLESAKHYELKGKALVETEETCEMVGGCEVESAQEGLRLKETDKQVE